MAKIPELPIKPRKELLVSLIGPLSNYAMATLSFLVNIILTILEKSMSFN
jgi:hypothetical protein